MFAQTCLVSGSEKWRTKLEIVFWVKNTLASVKIKISSGHSFANWLIINAFPDLPWNILRFTFGCVFWKEAINSFVLSVEASEPI